MANYSNEKFLKRFWKKVEKRANDECWPWLNSKTMCGYGLIGFNGKVEIASRLSWRMHRGEIPEGVCVLHRCDNPPCVNPEHLFLGTQRDNAIDRQQKLRGNRGESVPNSKLTEDAVRVIRIYVGCGMSQASMARHLGLNERTIHEVVSYKTWRHV